MTMVFIVHPILLPMLAQKVVLPMKCCVHHMKDLLAAKDQTNVTLDQKTIQGITIAQVPLIVLVNAHKASTVVPLVMMKMDANYPTNV